MQNSSDMLTGGWCGHRHSMWPCELLTALHVPCSRRLQSRSKDDVATSIPSQMLHVLCLVCLTKQSIYIQKSQGSFTTPRVKQPHNRYKQPDNAVSATCAAKRPATSNIGLRWHACTQAQQSSHESGTIRRGSLQGTHPAS